MICYIIVFILFLAGVAAVITGAYFVVSSRDLASILSATLTLLLAVAYTLQVWNSGQDMVDECMAKDNKNCCGCE